eukprot:CAMPEP_0179966998 /NCGR_PEP_ID=MMETSP0983-20121128/32865_1 /TAXON_ID=483367 /ORGANISM="non described non described, Strain CCMP 2436" /LENGTH=52 /DNA_ID=CAMNT_0021880237 /DNA_START=365 /DNA_END=524 /DNA_ORIENTATION=+
MSSALEVDETGVSEDVESSAAAVPQQRRERKLVLTAREYHRDREGQWDTRGP